MARASWHGQVIAESDDYHVVEGHVYFPPDTVKREFLRESRRTSICPWKGTASYYDVVVGGAENADAAWYYPDPKPAAEKITDYVAFGHGVTVQR